MGQRIRGATFEAAGKSVTAPTAAAETGAPVHTPDGVGVGDVQALMAAGGNLSMVQLAGGEARGAGVQEVAQRGVADGGGPLPHFGAIQAAFGRHDVSQVQAHVGGAAADASGALGARAYATGTHTAFGAAPDLHTAAHEAAHVVQQRGGVSLAGGVGRAGDAHERHADAVADRVVGGGSAEPLLDAYTGQGASTGPSSGPVQKLAAAVAPVQFIQYTSPTDVAIAALMATAGITDFGPYVWDDTNVAAPMFKLNAAFTAWTVDDCLNAARYQPEEIAKAVAGEKGKAALIGQRRKKAMQAVFGSTQGVADAILAHDGGKTPRALGSLSSEDGHSGGHTAERHILGAGLMTGHPQVAERAAFWYVGAVKMDLDDAGCASVFASAADAATAISAAVTAELGTNWATHRRSLAKNTQIKITAAVATKVVAYTKTDSPPGTPYPLTDKPKYMGGTGDRELYAGHYAGSSTAPDAPDASKAKLTSGGAANWSNVYVIIDPKASAPGGWAVYTAYPKP